MIHAGLWSRRRPIVRTDENTVRCSRRQGCWGLEGLPSVPSFLPLIVLQDPRGLSCVLVASVSPHVVHMHLHLVGSEINQMAWKSLSFSSESRETQRQGVSICSI